MKEKISALMDAELSSEDIDGQLAELKRDAGLRQAWNTYHLIGDALRGHHGRDIANRVARRIENEPTVLAPRRRVLERGRPAWFLVSAAASVAAVALVLWAALPMLRPQPDLAANANSPAAEANPALASGEVENYLLAHQPYSNLSAMKGLAPYIRTVSDSSKGAEKK